MLSIRLFGESEFSFERLLALVPGKTGPRFFLTKHWKEEMRKFRIPRQSLCLVQRKRQQPAILIHRSGKLLDQRFSGLG